MKIISALFPFPVSLEIKCYSDKEKFENYITFLELFHGGQLFSKLKKTLYSVYILKPGKQIFQVIVMLSISGYIVPFLV